MKFIYLNLIVNFMSFFLVTFLKLIMTSLLLFTITVKDAVDTEVATKSDDTTNTKRIEKKQSNMLHFFGRNTPIPKRSLAPLHYFSSKKSSKTYKRSTVKRALFLFNLFQVR